MLTSCLIASGNYEAFDETVNDSSSISIKKPATNQEELIFSDKNLQYKKDVKLDPNFIERFINWMSKTIFGNNREEDLYKARRILIWLIVIICMAIVIWILMRSEFSKLIKPDSKSTIFNFTELTDDIKSIDFNQMISKALSENNFRLAVRWQYLKILFLLDKKQLIVFEPQKTNFDYYKELNKSAFRKEFMNLSRIYEYTWYGEFEVKQNDYLKFEPKFNQIEKELHV